VLASARRLGTTGGTALDRAAGTARDSVTGATWTVVSRATGVLRVAIIGAVLGPTYLGNAFQFTNGLPNLVFYGFLAGSLFSSLLVPALVRHVDADDRAASERIAGGLLGLTLLGLVAVGGLVLALAPHALRLTAGRSTDAAVAGDQAAVAQLLLVLVMPQVFFYAVIGTSAAVMNSTGRFALPAAAPAVENAGVITVLLLVWVIFGTGHDVSDVTSAELLLLGGGSTVSVGLHAALQWWGARRTGVRLRVHRGWRDPDVKALLRRALPAVLQAGLMATQILALLAAVNQVAGGVIAFQMALNFYYLPIAVVATPVALSLLPRLSRLVDPADREAFRAVFQQGVALVLFVAVPAAVGYAALSRPVADVVSIGRMGTAAGSGLVAAALSALALGIVGQSVFMVATYASYSRGDAWQPLRSMALQATVCLLILSVPLRLAPDRNPVVTTGASFAIASVVGAWHLMRRVGGRDAFGRGAVLKPAARAAGGAIVMAGPAWAVAHVGARLWPGEPGGLVSLLCAVLVGAGVYGLVQRQCSAPELQWLRHGARGGVA
jgi:putative peptidoglycan lipid II flippase